MADSASHTISLLIPPAEEGKTETLQSQIQKVIAQKGHFRHVTERSLRAEAQQAAHAVDDTRSQGETEENGADASPQKQQERLWKRREEILERLGHAQNEILCALDFVSFLISKQSVPAQNSMSPALKDAVPMGSLAARVLQGSTAPPASTRRQLSDAAEGWMSNSFISGSQNLGAAASRLQADAARESAFWAHVAQLTTDGWAVSRLPRDRKAIGVHFGFADAAPQFRDRGFTLLRQSDDGTVSLAPHAPLNTSKRLAVSVMRNGVTTGSWTTARPPPGPHASLSQQLAAMRDALFEEELFFELGREARLAANQGVQLRTAIVSAEVSRDYQLVIEFGDHDAASSAPPSGEDSLVAEFVATALPLLLNAAHEHNLFRRSQRPPPMALKPRSTPEYALLRPILAHLRHRARVAALLGSYRAMIRPFERAGLPVTIAVNTSSSDMFDTVKGPTASSLLADLMAPAKTGFTVTLNGGRTVNVGLATYLGPPLFGSRYESGPIDFGFSRIPASHHETAEATILAVRRILLLDLVAHTESLAAETKLLDSKEALMKAWKVSQPEDGELTLYEADMAVRKIQIRLSGGTIVVRCSSMKKAAPSKHELWTWTADGCSRADGKAIVTPEGTTYDQAVGPLVTDDQ